MISTQRLFMVLVLCGILPAPGLADQIPVDTPPMGGPQQGVDVPLEMRPDDSRRVLVDEPAARQRSSTRADDAPAGGDAESGDAPSFRAGVELGRSQSLAGPESMRLLSNDELYGGLIPGVRDAGDRLPSESERALTWFGMQLDRAERTRLAVQIGNNIRYEVRPSGQNRFVLQLQNAQLAVHRLHRDVDASHFGRSVQAVRARSVGPHVELTIDLNRSAAPVVSREGGFLFLDFMENDSSR